MKKALFVLLAVISVFAVAGCQEEEPLPEIQEQPYSGDPSQRKFLDFWKLPVITEEPDPDGVTFDSIGIAGEGAYIMVQFKAPMSQSELWQQDYIYVVDEKTRGVYKDIPVAPVVGPLIGRPSQEGKMGYVMLLNYNGDIKSGSVVSVVLGNYKREHVTVP